MVKKYIFAIAIGTLLRQGIAYAPTMAPVYFNPPQTTFGKKTENLLEKITKDNEKRTNDLRKKLEELEKTRIIELNRQKNEKRLLEIDPIYGYISDTYNRIDVPKHITKKFVRAQIWAESWDTPNAKGEAGERGLMQLLPPAWNTVETKFSYERNAFDPWSNVNVGIRYLVWLDKKFNMINDKWPEMNDEEKRKVLAAAYNYGIGSMIKANYNLNKAPESTKRYIRNIETLMSEKYKDY